MHIDSHFDSGNIEVVEITNAKVANLRIKKDAGDEHMQWFHFRLDDAYNQEVTLRIVNAGDASYPSAWDGYRVCTSVDRQTWTRVDTDYSDGVLTIAHRPEGQMQWYAYFAPHTHEQHLDLLSHCQRSDAVTLDRLGATVDGRDLHRLIVGEGPLQFGPSQGSILEKVWRRGGWRVSWTVCSILMMRFPNVCAPWRRYTWCPT